MVFQHLFLLLDLWGFLDFFVLPTLSFAAAALANQDAVARLFRLSVSPQSSFCTPALKSGNAPTQGHSPCS